MYVMIEKL